MKNILREWFKRHIQEYGGVSDISIILAHWNVMVELESNAVIVCGDVLEGDSKVEFVAAKRLCNGIPIETNLAIREGFVLIVGINGRPLAILSHHHKENK